MSHLTASIIKITDLNILRKAVQASGFLSWVEGVSTFTSYYGGDRLKEQIAAIGTCEHAIAIKGARYQIGVIRRKDGEGWDLAFDPYDSAAAVQVGRNCETVTTMYSEEFIRDWAEKSGFLTERYIDADGKICITMTQ